MSKRSDTRHFLVGLARAFGGAILFALPLLMTMEMWELGFHMSRGRLLIMLLMNIPLLVALSYYAGFEDTYGLENDIVDAFVAFAVAMVCSVAFLLALGAIRFDMPADEIVGKVVLQALPASIGALLAASQFGQRDEQMERRRTGYVGGMFMMAVGALFLAWNLAPTEEMLLIAYRIGPANALALVALSLAIVHSFMFAMEFRGAPDIPEGTGEMRLFLTHTVPGYAIALLLSVYVLWTFGRLDGTGLTVAMTTTVVLAVPGAVGAAAARLIL